VVLVFDEVPKNAPRVPVPEQDSAIQLLGVAVFYE
jgi:hypothetical protein